MKFKEASLSTKVLVIATPLYFIFCLYAITLGYAKDGGFEVLAFIGFNCFALVYLLLSDWRRESEKVCVATETSEFPHEPPQGFPVNMTNQQIVDEIYRYFVLGAGRDLRGFEETNFLKYFIPKEDSYISLLSTKGDVDEMIKADEWGFGIIFGSDPSRIAFLRRLNYLHHVGIVNMLYVEFNGTPENYSVRICQAGTLGLIPRYAWAVGLASLCKLYDLAPPSPPGLFFDFIKQSNQEHVAA